MAKCRLTPSLPIREAIGPCPKDPALAKAWDEGAEIIHGYRLRHGVTSLDGHPLGPASGDAARRRERAEAQRRLARVQERLGHERVEAAQRSLEIAP